MRTLEQNLGVRLLNRTTRSMQPIEAGARLLARLQPVLQDLSAALREVDEFCNQPHGTLRINAPETAARLLVCHVVPPFLAKYRDMSVDIVTEGRLIDIVAEGFDAGVRLGEAVPQVMIAVHFDGEARFLAVASPHYLAQHGVPQVPDDLRAHACIHHRMPSGKLFRWEFARHGKVLAVDVNGPQTLDHTGLMVDAAADGLGIAYVPERAARGWFADGRLLPVLSDWCPAFPGFFLYYPGRRQIPAGLRAFIDVLRQRLA